jgi:exosome complex component MTR3
MSRQGADTKLLPFLRIPKAERKEGERQRSVDGRSAMGLRRIFVRTGAVSEAVGSCYLEAGRSKVLCSIYGPRPDAKAAHFSETGRLECIVKLSAFCGIPAAEQEQREKELPLQLRPALEAALQLTRFPKSVVDVCVLVLEQDGDISSPAITCASLALADAGIEMFDLVAACTVVKGDSGLMVDPQGSEAEGKARALTAIMPSRGEVTLLAHEGEWSLIELQQALGIGVEACKHIHSIMRNSLISSNSRQESTS